MNDEHKMTHFPVPIVSDPEMVFGYRGAYMTREELGDFYGFPRDNVFTEAASMLFMKGGKLEDYGLKFKPEIVHRDALRAIRAMLCSWAPQHEVKIGTVGYALSQWCEKIDA